jgi:hypothetical protein
MSVSITPNPNVQGPQGLTGSQGFNGLQGTEGLQGVQGVTGLQGLTGSQGTTGETGVQGVQGTTGSQGLDGIQGLTGTQGLQGLQGVFGTQGLSGQITPTTFDPETTAYTLLAANANQWVTMNSATSQTITVPPSVFTTGQIIYVQRIGSGAVPIAQGAGVTITSNGAVSSAPNLRAQFSSASILCTGTDTFTIVGDIS